jgi:hypothetical protein
MWQATLSDENAQNRVGLRLLFEFEEVIRWGATAPPFHATELKKVKLLTVKWLEDSITGKTDPIGDL